MNTMNQEQGAESYTVQQELNDQYRQNSGEEIIHRERIDNTPFEIVGNKKDGYFIAFGKFKVSNNYSHSDLLKVSGQELEYKTLAMEILDREQWMILANMLVLMKDLTAQDIYKQLIHEQKIKPTNND